MLLAKVTVGAASVSSVVFSTSISILYSKDSLSTNVIATPPVVMSISRVTVSLIVPTSASKEKSVEAGLASQFQVLGP